MNKRQIVGITFLQGALNLGNNVGGQLKKGGHLALTAKDALSNQRKDQHFHIWKCFPIQEY